MPLEPWIIEKIRERERREEEERRREQPQIPLDDPDDIPWRRPPEKEDPDAPKRGVIIIDQNAIGSFRVRPEIQGVFFRGIRRMAGRRQPCYAQTDMQEAAHLLRQLGLTDKEIVTYVALVSSGPISVRRLSKETSFSRPQLLQALDALERSGLVISFFRHKKQVFAGEDPERLFSLLEKRERSLAVIRRQMSEFMPELRAAHAHAGRQAVTRTYDGSKGIAILLRDVLRTIDALSDKSYRVCSAASLRDELYRDFPQFTKERILRRISVRVIAASAGGEPQPLSQRRWLPVGADAAAAYKIIYGDKIAFISKGADGLVGVRIDDPAIAAAECASFDWMWRALDSTKNP